MKGTRTKRRPDIGPRPAVCRCHRPPYPVATFRNSELVAVERHHWLLDGCELGTEQLDPATYGRAA